MVFEKYKQFLKHRHEESQKRSILKTENIYKKKEVECGSCGKMIARKNMKRRDVHGVADKNTFVVKELVKPFKCDDCKVRFNCKNAF